MIDWIQEAQESANERDLLAQTMWDVRAAFGFDTGGDDRYHGGTFAHIAESFRSDMMDVLASTSEAEREAYLAGYEFALRNLNDEPVQADLRRLAAGVNDDGALSWPLGAEGAPNESKGAVATAPAPAASLTGATCHCGSPVTFGFDGDPTHHRGMCAHCDPVRCDAYPGECGKS